MLAHAQALKTSRGKSGLGISLDDVSSFFHDARMVPVDGVRSIRDGKTCNYLVVLSGRQTE